MADNFALTEEFALACTDIKYVTISPEEALLQSVMQAIHEFDTKSEQRIEQKQFEDNCKNQLVQMWLQGYLAHKEERKNIHNQ